MDCSQNAGTLKTLTKDSVGHVYVKHQLISHTNLSPIPMISHYAYALILNSKNNLKVKACLLPSALAKAQQSVGALRPQCQLL